MNKRSIKQKAVTSYNRGMIHFISIRKGREESE